MSGRDAFFAFATERHAVYVRRSRGDPEPWTKDATLAVHHFCNVFRELDRGTAWLWSKWLEPNAEHARLWFAACVARRINWPDTLEELGFPGVWNPDRALATLHDRMRRGVKTYGGAYRLVTGKESQGDSSTHIVRRLLQPLWDARDEWPERHATMRETVAWLTRFHGWGPFVAYQVALDLSHTRYLKDASDVADWSPVGPGSARGLNRVHGRAVDAPAREEQALDEMRALAAEQRGRWPSEYPRLRVSDIEHALCEFDKYERIRAGAGQLRLFKPSGRPLGEK